MSRTENWSSNGLIKSKSLNSITVNQTDREPSFYYFAYGSCMCPIDLKRSLQEHTHSFVVGTATLQGYRLGFYRRSRRRNCGVLDIVKDTAGQVEGVLYYLPLRLSNLLDEREEVPRGGYRQHLIDVSCKGKVYKQVRTYVVVNKLDRELAPNDWYFDVVLRGAVTSGVSETYCWQLFEHMYNLQRQQALPDLAAKNGKNLSQSNFRKRGSQGREFSSRLDPS